MFAHEKGFLVAVQDALYNESSRLFDLADGAHDDSFDGFHYDGDYPPLISATDAYNQFNRRFSWPHPATYFLYATSDWALVDTGDEALEYIPF